MGKYDAKRVYSNQNVVDSYDYKRFTSAGGKLFDTIEKNVVLRNIPSKKGQISVLEVGAGTGRFTIELARLGLSVMACDISAPMLKEIQKKALNLEGNLALVNGDIYSLPCKDNSFDYIVCMRVLNQLGENENKEEALKELCRVCSLNGTILFDFINSRSLAIFARANKSGLTSVGEMERLVNGISEIEVRDISGRLVLPRTLFEKCPKCFLKVAERIDYLFAKWFPKYATRVYFVLKKI
jgi:ubiquinone/menaquinone biosynthesis C-methylase UbiE